MFGNAIWHEECTSYFQRMINGVIAGLDGCDAYIDDVAVYSNTWEQHMVQLKFFLSWIKLSKPTSP